MRNIYLMAAAATLAFSPLEVFADGSVIVAEGFSEPNTYDESLLPEWFSDWCNDSEDGLPCVPTVALEVTDVKKTRSLGKIYAWGKDFVDSNAFGITLQFREFILYDFNEGQIFTISQDGGHPGGNFADPALIPPKVPGNLVLLGGAEGQVVGGTGKYANASGGYSTRLKVESDGIFFNYYDELYFRFREVKIN